jgi:2-succinyl-6-hydroxy-2,4-cyclohexadiene-1-carboxylate synthase
MRAGAAEEARSACPRQESLAVSLHGERDGSGPRIVLLHGFGQTGRCWGPLAPALAAGHEVVRLDAPGHGGSSGVAADLPTTGRLVAETAGPAVVLGYSMGARMALHVATEAPEAVRALVLVGGTPGIEDDAERAERRAADRALARRIRDEGVDAFVERWLALPMFAGLPPDGRFEAERRRNTAEGLATSLELAGTGSQQPLWDALPAIDVPVLVVAGEDDRRYADIAARTASTVGDNARAALVAGAGHSAHLEQPAALTELVLAWLDDLGPTGRRGRR